ncbi:signal recognition particle 14-like protein [Jimgerdemannia flammicorona]|uniref:Signal recognition particle subunit SRP14 n=1 Tax=Jimgerdemannia flammicorona TaxID=994334 RepID=A0A433QU26_9FUNG|nr:signal recognition particle 14-like protein [Jimgerdemannia flammicorona]
MTLLDNDAFLTQLTRCFEKSKANGTVYITMKRQPEKPPKKDAKKDANKDVPMADAKDDDDDREHPCLVRAVYKKTKISALVHASNTDRFQFNYGNIVKVHMDSLKKKDRKAKTALKKRTANKKPKATA